MAINYELEIPEAVSMKGWKEIPIEECGEGLVVLNYLDPRIEVEPVYYRRELKGASPEVLVREGVAKRLVKAADLLPQGYSLLVFDGFRTLTTQQDLYDREYQVQMEKHPNHGPEALSEDTQVYVSIPSSDLSKPSPHATGGAVDLTLIGNDINLSNLAERLGTEFDSFDKEAATAYFLKTAEDEINSNRGLFCQVMIAAGFTNYPEEWWHFDFGNQFWAKVSGAEHAIYGLADYPTPVDPGQNAEHRFIRLWDDTKTASVRFTIEGTIENIQRAFRTIGDLEQPHFPLKQRLLVNAFRESGVLAYPGVY